MALGALGIGALASGGSSLFQAIMSGIQAARGAKGFNRTMANRPLLGAEYTKPYEDILAKYNQVYGGNKPGFEQQLGLIDQLRARAMGSAERGAISSSTYGSQVADLYQKQLDATQKEYLSNAGFKLGGVDKIAGAAAMLGEKQTEQWNINKYIPFQTELNRYGEMEKTGKEGVYSAIQSGFGNISDYFGTKYIQDMYGKLKLNNGKF